MNLSHEIYFNDEDDGDIKCHFSIVRKAHKDRYHGGISLKLCLLSSRDLIDIDIYWFLKVSLQTLRIGGKIII